MTLLAVALLAAATSVPAASARPLFLEGFVNISKTCSDVPPDHRYSCAQQKSWGKCGASFMKGKCCQTCHGCDPSCTAGGGGGGGGGKKHGTWSAYATHYNAGQAGTPICGGATSGFVCAPSDVSSMWSQLGGKPCGEPTNKHTCTCDVGHGCPKCSGSQSVCGKRVEIFCEGDSSECIDGVSIVVEINNVCPHSHPCNIKHNVCTRGGDPNHIDISKTAFQKLIHRQSSAIGTAISYSLTSKSPGVYNMNTGEMLEDALATRLYDTDVAHNMTGQNMTSIFRR